MRSKAALLQQLADLAADGEPLHFVLDYRGHHVELTSGPSAPVAPVAPAKLTESDKTVLQAVAELPELPTAAEIAKASGYTNDSHLRMRLSRLRHCGLLGGDKGEAGYPLTPEGWSAIGEPPELTSTPERGITPAERCILKAVYSSGADNPTGEEIAAAAKLKNSPRFRNFLSALRKRGLLSGNPREPGYSITAKGRAALEPPQGTIE